MFELDLDEAILFRELFSVKYANPYATKHSLLVLELDNFISDETIEDEL